MSAYTLSQAEYKRLKSRLTRVENTLRKAANEVRADKFNKDKQTAALKAADAVLKEADYALGVFQEKGYPDDWHRWERAQDDAKTHRQIYGKGPGIYSW